MQCAVQLCAAEHGEQDSLYGWKCPNNNTLLRLQVQVIRYPALYRTAHSSQYIGSQPRGVPTAVPCAAISATVQYGLLTPVVTVGLRYIGRRLLPQCRSGQSHKSQTFSRRSELWDPAPCRLNMNMSLSCRKVASSDGLGFCVQYHDHQPLLCPGRDVSERFGS